MQHMPLLMISEWTSPGPEGSTSPGVVLYLALSFFVCAALPATADDQGEIIWEDWQAPILEVWENWREQRFLVPDPTASFEPVADAYYQAAKVFSGLPLSAIESEGLRAHLIVLNALTFHLLPLHPAEHSGFSVDKAYQQALLTWQELLRREHANSADAELLMQIALGTRHFETAVEINETGKLGLSIPAGVADSDKTLSEAGRKVWLFDDDDHVEVHSYEFPDDLHWVVVSIEGCGFFQRLLHDIHRIRQLEDLLAGSVSWLLPPSPYLEMPLIERARTSKLSIQPIFIHKTEDWPMFDDMTSSPVIRLMRGEKVLETWIAWPEEGGHLLEMTAAWEKHQASGE